MNFIDILFYCIAFIITVPIISTWLCYKILKKAYKHPLKAFHKSIQWTTFIYIMAVIFLFNLVFSIHIIGYTLLFLLILITIIIYMQWKHQGEILIGKAFNLLWRIAFLLFFVMYCLLIIIGIIQKIFY